MLQFRPLFRSEPMRLKTNTCNMKLFYVNCVGQFKPESDNNGHISVDMATNMALYLATLLQIRQCDLKFGFYGYKSGYTVYYPSCE